MDMKVCSVFKVIRFLLQISFSKFRIGGDYGYTWPDAIQIKGSVYHSNGMDLIA